MHSGAGRLSGPLPSTTILSLSAMPDRLESLFGLVPQNRWNWVPASWDGIPGEMFSPLGQVCHVRDIEIEGYHIRIERMLSENHPSLVSLDSYEIAVRRNYESNDPTEALHSFRSARDHTVRLLQDLTPEKLNRTGTFAEYGELTLQSLVHYLLSHDYQHLACLEWLLGKIHALHA